ncbi:hypothetical protein [Morganella morganii]|uniref:hypothetical protein n=1 Tax=Morganella morganii TaxID=582 RepID=UPI0037514632
MTDSKQQNSSGGEIKKITIWNLVQAICIVLFVFFILLKFYDSSFEVDFSALLSIILAMFSIWLSAMFYFKATETSNRFYEHTYNHSRGISELLVKIESGFGEKLSNLHENYSSIKDYIQNPSEKQREDIENEMTKMVGELNNIKSSKDEIINKLIHDANIAEKDKIIIRKELEGKDKSLKAARNKIELLEGELSELNDKEVSSKGLPRNFRGFENYFKRMLLPLLLRNKDGSFNDNLSPDELNERFSEVRENSDLSPAFFHDGIRGNYFSHDGGLTLKGLNLIYKTKNVD